ncbi:uncharacterized protein TM35_000301200 [Trypanosoma theileri]|uniref:Trichohyalin-plectin-homology domain-containing protein n=1 Tax=Trypanosoma theileri TaxID=67003 RepID=A0A1X0NPL9_9TRYP|nr:uncharacterized protein TM35_000301200 [Trypanosoma theileri]ORC86080.1 hypothetical protein TM35_000301200 [Trypanosoma theileri]
MPAVPASVPVPMTRARVDPKRKVGLANAVAQGRLLYRVGILAESELYAIRHLANAIDDEDAHNAYRQQEDERRREASKARTNLWPDTLQAKQEAAIRRRQAEKEEEERRKNMLLELGAQQEEEERRQKQAQLALKLLKEDPRGRNVRSLVMLNEAIKDRENQIAFKNELKRKEEEEARLEKELMDQGKDEYLAKEEQEKFDRRSRNVAEKNEHLQQMLFQIQERKKMRAEKKEGGEEARRAAEEEKQENLEALLENRELMARIHEYNRSIAKPPLSKHDRLLQRIQREEGDEAARALQEEKLESMKREVMEKMRRKQELSEKRREQGFLAFAAENERMQHKARTQEVFERRGVSMLERLAASEDRQRERQKEQRRQQVEALKHPEEAEANDNGLTRRAAASQWGFIHDSEAEAYRQEMQAHPARVAAEREAEARERRAEAERLQRIHRLQAEERRENDRRTRADDMESRERQRQAMEEDDANYRAYIVSQLPDNMVPYLQTKAMQLRS